MKKTLFYALGILLGSLLLASCNQSQPPETKAKEAKEAKAADDPRMAGFKGKIAKKYEDSKEDWPVRPKGVRERA